MTDILIIVLQTVCCLVLLSVFRKEAIHAKYSMCTVDMSPEIPHLLLLTLYNTFILTMRPSRAG